MTDLLTRDGLLFQEALVIAIINSRALGGATAYHHRATAKQDSPLARDILTVLADGPVVWNDITARVNARARKVRDMLCALKREGKVTVHRSRAGGADRVWYTRVEDEA